MYCRKNSIFRLLFSISSRDSDKGRNYKSPSISNELVVLLYLLCFCTDGGVDGKQMKLRRTVGGLLGCVVRRVNGDPYFQGSINVRRSEGSNVMRRYTGSKPPFLLLMNVIAGPSIDGCVLGKSKTDLVMCCQSSHQATLSMSQFLYWQKF